MSAHVPKRVADMRLFTPLTAAGLDMINVGKVRHTFNVPDHPDRLLIVASDRLSIYDFVLNIRIDDKGAVLTAMTVDWLTRVLAGIPNHLIASGAGIDEFLPEQLRGNSELQKVAMVVKRLNMPPVEFVIRGYLMGSGWKEYKQSQTVCGIPLPPGLQEGSKLPEPILTPATKAESGHDENITFEQMVDVLAEWLKAEGIQRDARELAEEIRDKALDVYNRGEAHANTCDTIIFDTKFEFGLDENGQVVLADEVLTPDSSRFGTRAEYEKALAAGTTPPTCDKETVRVLGKKTETTCVDDSGAKIVGINNLKPENPAHVAYIDELDWTVTVRDDTAELYRMIFKTEVGVSLAEFQIETMGIAA